VSLLWPILLLLAAAALAVAGLRGRIVDRHPLCRRCGYDLSAWPGGGMQCPECGQVVRNRVKWMRCGNRRPRRGLLAWALALAMPGALWLLLVAPLYLGSTNLERTYPLSWLLANAQGSSPAARSGALREINRRLAAGELNEVERGRVMEAALACGDAAAGRWDAAWAQVLSRLDAARSLSGPAWEQFVRQAVKLELRPRPHWRGGTLVRLDVELGPGTLVRVERGGPADVRYRLMRVEIDGQAVAAVSDADEFNLELLRALPAEGGAAARLARIETAGVLAGLSRGWHTLTVLVSCQGIRDGQAAGPPLTAQFAQAFELAPPPD